MPGTSMAKKKTATARKKTAKKKTVKRRAAKRTLLDTGTDKRYVRRRGGGRFAESDDVGRAAKTDPRRRAKAKAKRGHGDRGDR